MSKKLKIYKCYIFDQKPGIPQPHPHFGCEVTKWLFACVSWEKRIRHIKGPAELYFQTYWVRRGWESDSAIEVGENVAPLTKVSIKRRPDVDSLSLNQLFFLPLFDNNKSANFSCAWKTQKSPVKVSRNRSFLGGANFRHYVFHHK